MRVLLSHKMAARQFSGESNFAARHLNCLAGPSLGTSVIQAAQGQERKICLNTKFLGGMTRRRPGGYPGGRPGPKTFTPSLGAQENTVFCADVLDPKARTSMTPGGLRKTLCRETSG